MHVHIGAYICFETPNLPHRHQQPQQPPQLTHHQNNWRHAWSADSAAPSQCRASFRSASRSNRCESVRRDWPCWCFFSAAAQRLVVDHLWLLLNCIAMHDGCVCLFVDSNGIWAASNQPNWPHTYVNNNTTHTHTLADISNNVKIARAYQVHTTSAPTWMVAKLHTLTSTFSFVGTAISRNCLHFIASVRKCMAPTRWRCVFCITYDDDITSCQTVQSERKKAVLPMNNIRRAVFFRWSGHSCDVRFSE